MKLKGGIHRVKTFFTSAPNCEWSILWSPSTRVSDGFHVYCFRKQLKGQCREIFNCWFFSWISFPQAPEYTIRAVSNFFEHSLRYLQHKCTTSVIDTSGKWKKSSIIKVLIILFGHLLEVELTYRYIFATGVVDSSGKFATGINNISETGGKICRWCRWHRWQIVIGVIDTDGKFAASWHWWQICHRYQQQKQNWWQNFPPVSLISVLHLDLRISPQIFEKKFETVLLGYSGAGGKLIHEKTRCKKSRDTVPLSKDEKKTFALYVALPFLLFISIVPISTGKCTT